MWCKLIISSKTIFLDLILFSLPFKREIVIHCTEWRVESTSISVISIRFTLPIIDISGCSTIRILFH